MSRSVDDPAWMNYFRFVTLAAFVSLVIGQDEMWHRASAALALAVHASMYGFGVAVRTRREADR